MMKRSTPSFFLFLLLMWHLLLSAAADNNAPASSKIEIRNGSFEMVKNNHPVYWVTDNDIPVWIDSIPAPFGRNSLMIHHPGWDESVILSDPVNLTIGHLYRLSAWVKTENVFSNPYQRYPTPVAGCITMESFPFTNHSPAAGASRDWQKIEVLFIATQKVDRIRLHLGYNGKATGKIWFDQVELEKVEDISRYIPPENVIWFDNGFRYEDQGWIFVHIEGDPYRRGYQYGYLVAEEMVEYMNKLAIETNPGDPKQGWTDTRFVADAFMLRKYEKEYLTEMQGIADGANHAGTKLFDRELDLIDVVTMNSAIDIEWARYAMSSTANPLSGQNFLKQEDEILLPNRLHKCSSFLANRSTTVDGRIVFGQLFMWGGYTGPHWNVICDVVPSSGHRLVYETFPGGIHSGADFYINSAGIMIGETTVQQTPFNPEGTPQSNRIRKAAQYASSIDEVVKILITDNNGMYANDWLIGDTKSDEIAILLLGTYQHKLWRSSRGEFYGDTRDYYWCNNNPKDLGVRKEYIPNPDNAPYDLIFSPWNRDIAFNQFYQEQKGKMDAPVAARGLATSPINRPHACDGKVTTSEMAEQLVFMAHYGKVTLREKFVGENRRIPDLPGAQPRLTLGYSVISPVFVTNKLKSLKNDSIAVKNQTEKPVNFETIRKELSYRQRDLWHNTVYPAANADNWFISGTAAYWKIMNKLPGSPEAQLEYLQQELSELNYRYLYLTEREGTVAPDRVSQRYTQYNHYQIPRIKGTVALHQLRLLLGNKIFSDIMTAVHDQYRGREMSTDNFIRTAEKISGKPLASFINQWVTREDIPRPHLTARLAENTPNQGWQIDLDVTQPGDPYHFVTTLRIETADSVYFQRIIVQGNHHTDQFTIHTRPTKLIFNALNDVLLPAENHFTWSNFFDDFHQTIVVYGTRRQVEANHTMALRFSTVLADRFTELLLPVIKDSEITTEELANNDLIVLGGVADNSLMDTLAHLLQISLIRNGFFWQEKSHSRSDDGLFLAFPNPFNSKKTVYLLAANSALQLYRMTRSYYSMPAWAVFRSDKIVEKGYHVPQEYLITFP